MCAESRVKVMQAREKLEVSGMLALPQGRSLTNTAPIACLPTPSSVMQAKRAPDGFRTKRLRGTHYVYGVGTEERGLKPATRLQRPLRLSANGLNYEASYSHPGRHVPRASSLSQ